MTKAMTKVKKTKKTVKQTKKKIINKNILGSKKFDEQVFNERLHKYYDELKWLYCELYQDNEKALSFFNDLEVILKNYAVSRADYLRYLDEIRVNDSKWYQARNFIGMSMYPDCFAGNFKSYEKRLPYLSESNVNYVYLDSVFDDNGDVLKHLGSIKDFVKLIEKLHEKDINVCVDINLNNTGVEHEWMIRSSHGEKTYQERYWLFDDEETAKAYLDTNSNVYEVTYLKNIEKYGLTTNQGKRVELNYHNPIVFNKMIEKLLILANEGIDIIGIKGTEYLWKQQGANGYEVPQNHNIARMLKIVCEIVCPAVILLGKMNSAPNMAATYFGTEEKGEYQIICNTTISAQLWHTVATEECALLKKSIDELELVSKDNIYQNSLRELNGINWNLDYEFLKSQNMDEKLHRKYLNEFFEGEFKGSVACGEIEKSDKDDMKYLYGTTASLCGIEYYDQKKDKKGVVQSINCDLMLHGVILALSGIPMICSGDEIAQYNDYSYKKTSHKKNNPQYLNKAVFNWRKAGRRNIDKAIQAGIYQGLNKMEILRNKYDVFSNSAQINTLDTWDKAVLAIKRENANAVFIGLYNFSKQERTAWIKENGLYVDLLTDNTDIKAEGIKLQPYQIMWLFSPKEN